MKIIFHIPKINSERLPQLIDRGWVKLKEPSSILLSILASIPLMIFAGGVTFTLIILFFPINLTDYGFQLSSFTFNINLLHIIAIFLLLIIHELVHLMLIPNFMKSNKTWMGIQVFGGFILTEEILSRKRFLIISIAPYLLISIILPLIFGILGWMNLTIIFLFILNAVGSSVDLLGIILVLYQVPKNANIINSGMSTFWKGND